MLAAIDEDVPMFMNYSFEQSNCHISNKLLRVFCCFFFLCVCVCVFFWGGGLFFFLVFFWYIPLFVVTLPSKYICSFEFQSCVFNTYYLLCRAGRQHRRW